MNFKTREAAQKCADAMVLSMNNPENWKTRVWDNLGWTCSISNGVATITPVYSDGDIEYCCMIADKYPSMGSGSCLWTTTSFEKDPNIALIKEYNSARKAIENLTKCVDTIKLL